MQRPVVVRNRILVRSEPGQVHVDESVQLTQRTGSGCGPGCGGFMPQFCGNLAVNVVAFVLEVRRPRVVLGGWQPVLGVIVPLATLGLSAGHQYP